MSFPNSLVQNKIRGIPRSRSLSRLILLLVVTLGFVPTVNAAVHGFEVGTVALPSTAGGVMTTVTLAQTYNSPLVFVMTPNTGNDPVAIRVNNITGGSFDLAQFEPTGESGGHGAMTVSYFVIDEGTYDLGNGLLIEAGRISTDLRVQADPPFPNTGTGFETINFSTTFADTPTVLVDIQTDNSGGLTSVGSPEVPWITTAAQNLSATSIDVSLERAEVADGGAVLAEDIGYVAIETGEHMIFDIDNNPITLLALITGDVITGWDNIVPPETDPGTGVKIDFGTSLGLDPLVVASLASRDGANGGWLRAGTLNGTSINLMVDEDTFLDDERLHTTESASIVGFSSSEFSFQAPTPSTLALFGFGSLLLLRLRRRKNTRGSDSILA